jgi:hypothetical protein
MRDKGCLCRLLSIGSCGERRQGCSYCCEDKRRLHEVSKVLWNMVTPFSATFSYPWYWRPHGLVFSLRGFFESTAESDSLGENAVSLVTFTCHVGFLVTSTGPSDRPPRASGALLDDFSRTRGKKKHSTSRLTKPSQRRRALGGTSRRVASHDQAAGGETRRCITPRL